MTAAAQDVTAPRYARTLAERAALLEQFPQLAADRPDGWVITTGLDHGAPWVLEWHRLTLRVDTRSSLELARLVVAVRAACRRDLRELVVGTAIAIGLPRHPFLHPAQVRVNTGLTRCDVCGCQVLASRHVPGSLDCFEDQRERDRSRRQ